MGIVIDGTYGLDAGDTKIEGIEKLISESIDRWEASFHRIGIEAARDEQIPLGLWVGETEVPVACTESRRVILDLAFEEQLEATFGVAVFGDGAPPPPPNDPNIGYPPGVIDNGYDNLYSDSNLWCYLKTPTEGYGYTILDGYISENGRFQFRIAVLEPYDDWCFLQTSYPCNFYYCMTEYNCVPEIAEKQREACNWSIEYPRYPESPDYVPCPFELGKYQLCDSTDTLAPCICEQNGCRADMNRTILFDMMIDKDELHGQMTSLFANGRQPVEIKLRKQTL